MEPIKGDFIQYTNLKGVINYLSLNVRNVFTTNFDENWKQNFIVL
jgi:hypothetical protein